VTERRGHFDQAPPPPRFDSSLNRCSFYFSNKILQQFLLLFICRTSQYDRERERERDRPTDIKKRLDDFSKPRDDSYSKGRDDFKREPYKNNRDDYKREVEISRHSSSGYGSTSSRIEPSTASLNKDRYSERSTGSDSHYRGGGSSRNDDVRTTSNKSRFFETQQDTRYERPAQSVTNTSAWNTNSTHQYSLNPNDIWNAKQQQQTQQDTGNSWRGGMDDNRDYRFSNDRKVTSQYIEPNVRANQYMGGNSNLLQSASARFNSQRW
jgi:hypothetical protein